MADYPSIQSAMDSGILNMTVVRDVRADSSTDIVSLPEGLDFYHNGLKQSTIRVNSDSWIGFTTNTQHMRMNQRDGAVTHIWREDGFIGFLPYLRIRWRGNSRYNSTDEDTLQEWEIFLLGDNRIILNFIKKASSYGTGNYNLVAQDTLTYEIPEEGGIVQFESSDQGFNWSLKYDMDDLSGPFKSYGEAGFFLDAGNALIMDSKILWEEYVPPGTTIEVLSSTDDINYAPVSSGGEVLPSNTQLTNGIFLKVVMTTNNDEITPTLSNLNVLLYSDEDLKKITLVMEPLDKFNNAVGPITVAYSGGTLMGEGGPVESFEETFLPTDLIAKPNQHPVEHIDLTDVKVAAVLTKIDFPTIGDHNTEHIDLVDVKLTANLIHIDDI